MSTYRELLLPATEMAGEWEAVSVHTCLWCGSSFWRGPSWQGSAWDAVGWMRVVPPLLLCELGRGQGLGVTSPLRCAPLLDAGCWMLDAIR